MIIIIITMTITMIRTEQLLGKLGRKDRAALELISSFECKEATLLARCLSLSSQ